MKLLMTRAEIAKFLSVSVPTVDRWVSVGMPCYKIRHSVRFDAEQVLEWVKQQSK